jgi:multisubunit Na+/H+ antiporter MnhB subunit
MADDSLDGAPVDAPDLSLLRRFEPILRFTEGEFFFPALVDDYVRCCELFEQGPDRQRVLLAPKGSLTIEQLVEFGADHPRPGHYLRFVDTPFTRLEVAKWRVRGDRPRFHNASRLARVGVLSRGLDALNRASLIFRGRNTSGTQAAAETLYRTGMDPDHHPYYGRVVRDGGYTVLQYWFFYAFNDWRSRVFGVNDHEADWEQVTIYLVGQDDELRPAWLVSSAHDEVGDDLRRRWDDPDLTIEGEHPVIFAGLGSHSGAYIAGEYLTTHDVPAFAGLLRLTRRISRTLLPWTRDLDQAGLSIPYIDYARGDGIAIGPGAQREWEPIVIDETTPWVVHYRGLWGNDTRDPLGGERGPAGPRYERSTMVRGSWGDPVDWAGLRKVPPDAAAADEALHARLAELDSAVEQLDARIEHHQTAQRATVAGGENVPPRDEAELSALATERVALHDQQLLLADRLGRPPAALGPHDHLRHRRVPLPNETPGRRRVLAIWSAISTSVVLVVVMIIVLAPGWDVDGIAVETVIVLFALEALARKQLWRFALLVVAFLAVGALVLALSGALLADWQLVVAFPLGLAAAALLFLNVRELLRD